MENEKSVKQFQVRTSDAKINVPMGVLNKFGVVRQLLENYPCNDDVTVPLPGIDSETMHLILKWNDETEMVMDTLWWEEFVRLILAARYLDFTELTEFIAMNTIPKFIHCCPYDTRKALSFEPITIEVDDDNWDRNPFDELDDANYILDGFPIEIVKEMFFNISLKHKKILLDTFAPCHRFYEVLRDEYNKALESGYC